MRICKSLSTPFTKINFRYIIFAMSLIDQISISRKAKHRLRQILKMRKHGMTMEAIGLELGISKQRVSQVLKPKEGKK